MIKGETVVVERREQVGVNAHREPVYEWVSETVHDVLVAPGPRNDIPDGSRPEGVTIAWSLHFPKTFTRSLDGARISVRGQTPCKVVGDPQPYTLANTPTRWWMPIELTRANG